ncbi:MAG: NAD-dependent epimerase/dehydratase family protein [Caldilineales bacterium]|nr:NAD-dependent epimerase/dehydratase family protein [Caldilineales bacterium]MDW8318014.1 NAD-dependent epimerase/dehydratase family protein [Anaerolineae bacterium]
MTTVLVTGGAGFIGSHTVDLLLARGYRVRILDALLPPVHRGGQPPDYLPADAELLVGDVRDRAALRRALEGVELVVHLAAYQDYLTDFSRFFDVNATGTALLYELIVNERLPVRKVVVASSQAVYGEGKYRCPRDGVQYPPLRPESQLRAGQWEVRCPACGRPMQLCPTDEAVVNPHNQYAMSKHAQEMIALNLGQRYGIPTVALRYSITQGPRQSFRNAYSGICRIFVTRLLAGRAPVAYEDGRQLRDYVSVEDVARANLLALEDPRADYQAFNVGGGQAVSVLEYAALAAEVLGVDIPVQVPGEYRFGDTRHIVSDIGKLQALGWQPQTSLRQIIADYAEWASRQPDLQDYSERAEQVMKAVGAVRRAAVLPAPAGSRLC